MALQVRNTGIVGLADGTGVVNVVRFPVIEGFVMEVSAVHWTIAEVGQVTPSWALAGFAHNLNAPVPTGILNLASRDDLWAFGYVNLGNAQIRFDPPFRIVGNQLAMYWTESGRTENVNAAIHWQWARASSLEWTELHSRTSRETG